MPDQPEEPIIRVRGLVNRFGSEIVHNGLDLEVISGEVLGVGTYREPGRNQHGFFLRIRGLDAATASTALRKSDYTVL